MISEKEIVRAWKDEEFRERLGVALLPEHPAGQIELSDGSLTGTQEGLQPQTNIYATTCCLTETWWWTCSGNCTGGCY